ncbi:putative IS1 encoded protein [Shigella flexneri K-315]|uniref:Putative IS1 encoded protein n=1 Tax=Shigella flexneri K-315 TaxID=766150 RepID=I6CBQ3_SHIFL|nr:putative IS1 encoded protein [Shigella flexneri K-315]
MPCFTAMRAEIALMSGSAFAVTHHAFSSGAGRTSDGNGSHASTLKSPSYTKSVSWQHYLACEDTSPCGESASIIFGNCSASKLEAVLVSTPSFCPRSDTAFVPSADSSCSPLTD